MTLTGLGHDRNQLMRHRRTALIVGTMAIVLAIGVGALVLDGQRAQNAQRANVEDELATHAARLQGAISERLRETRSLSITAADGSTDDVEELVQQLSARDPGLLGGLVLEDGSVLSGAMPGVPAGLQSAMGLDVDLVGSQIYDPDDLDGSTGQILAEMAEEGSTGIAGPLEVPVVPFDLLLAAQSVPDTDGRQVALLVINFDHVLADADISRETMLAGDDIQAALTVDSAIDGENVGAATAFGTTAGNPVVVPVLAPDVEWSLAGTPMGGWTTWSPATPAIVVLTLLSGILAGLMVAHRFDLRMELGRALTVAEEEARRARMREQMLARHAPAGLVEVGDDGIVLSTNPAAERLLQTSEGELVGRPLPASLADALAAAAGHEEDSPDRRVEWWPTESRVLAVSWSVNGASPEPETDAHADQTVLSLHDVTREHAAAEVQRRHLAILEQIQADHAEVQRIRSDLINKVSHELRTPLTVIQGVSEMLGAGVPPEQADELIQALRRQARRLGTTLDHLLRVAEPMPLADLLTDDEDGETETGQLFAQVAARLGLEVQRDGIPVHARAGDEPVRAIADLLLTNALEHGTPPVRITTWSDAEMVYVDVADAGTPPDVGAAAFELFVQASVGDGRRTGGLGLGLPTALRVARRAGGDLVLLDLPTTTFRLSLPRAAVPAEEPVDPDLVGDVTAQRR